MLFSSLYISNPIHFKFYIFTCHRTEKTIYLDSDIFVSAFLSA
ncbi:glycosyltransferase [Methanosarcina sp.]